jgi:hypothetical protein
LGKSYSQQPPETNTALVNQTVALYFSDTDCQIQPNECIRNTKITPEACKEQRRQLIRSTSAHSSHVQRNKQKSHVSDKHSATNGAVKRNLTHLIAITLNTRVQRGSSFYICIYIYIYIYIQWRPLIIIADNVINRLLLSKSVVPKHSI